MPPGEQIFDHWVGPFGDVVRVRFLVVNGEIQRFTVQLELFVENRYIAAIRFDTAHGFAHRDILDWNGATVHWNRTTEPGNFSSSLTEAITDVNTNWERYRSDFFQRRL